MAIAHKIAFWRAFSDGTTGVVLRRLPCHHQQCRQFQFLGALSLIDMRTVTAPSQRLRLGRTLGL